MFSTLLPAERVYGLDHAQQAHVAGNVNDDMDMSATIMAILSEYALHKFDGTGVCPTKFQDTLINFVGARKQLSMILPSFAFKSANKVHKVLGIYPDKAEELALERLNSLCTSIAKVYKPGAKITIISDGLVFNDEADLLSTPDREVWAYAEGLYTMVINKGFTHIEFAHLNDIVHVPRLPATLNEVTFVANATNFRRCLLNEFAHHDMDIDHEIATQEDILMMYRGYKRFLESDLRYIFPAGGGRSNGQYKRDVKFLAKQLLARRFAFSRAVEAGFPNTLRLSIHASHDERKVAVGLLRTKSVYTTPWTCTMARRADGEWVSGLSADFKDNEAWELVFEDGRPSYFQEVIA
ncbi:hypothetical protein HYFRA_00014095 [Hymenoscyphus fraxineus]|uniref:Pyoverdine biosynthesis n=1 Tax=Hymenoscyphus fraxineus TaxID=746836 RepID=A0A9N9LCX2_9HELO|nr:hypothetical protein HYFRA_00014095 [Hymenoscyphus fraxineus]